MAQSVRRPRPALALLLALISGCIWLAVPLNARQDDDKGKPPPKAGEPPAKGAPPKGLPKEEEEDTKKGPARKKVDDSEPPTDPSQPDPPSEQPNQENVYVVKLDDLARAATNARHPDLKAFFTKYVVAYDKLTEKSGKVSRITPVPALWGKDRYPAEFGVAVLDDANQPGEPGGIERKTVRRIEHFESIVLKDVDLLLNPEPGTRPPENPIPPADQLAAAERVLTAVMFFHESARERNKRRGKSWDSVKAEIYEKLTAIRLDRIRQVGKDRDWATLNALTKRLIELYRSNPKVLEQVYAARLAEAEALVKSDKVSDLERARQILSDYESRFPGTGNQTAQKVNDELAERARKFLNEALRTTNQAEARNLLKQVEANTPDNPTLRKMQSQLKADYPILVVGAKRLPERMSPATARYDSELQAVELMFEGLLEAIPDEQLGVRFQLALAADRPTVGAGIRDVHLVRTADWGLDRTGDAKIDARRRFDSADVAGTLRLYRQKPHTWAADPVNWFDDPVFDPADPGRVRMRFRTGHPDPRSLLTLKLLPAEWFREKNKAVDDLEFAARPFGTGPFKLDPASVRGKPNDPPRNVVFVANPLYGLRAGRTGQPFIKEIQFTQESLYDNLPAEVAAGRIHLLTDVPTTDLPRFTANSGQNGRVRVLTAAANRRVHLLAINHHKPALQSADLRRALTHAIDRERVLTDVYRGTQAEAHKAMTGPFPPGCWATPRPQGAAAPSLTNPSLAGAKFKAFLGGPTAVSTLRLAYPDDDPQAKLACERMKTMIESATALDDRKLTIALDPLPPRELLRRVEDLHDYDLAYVHFDYRDDWYPQALGSFLDPTAAIPGGRNYLGYLAKDTTPSAEDEKLGRLLGAVRLYREPGRLDQLAHDIHRDFNAAVPFVPLWQLDRHLVINTSVKVWLDGQAAEASPRMLDQTRLFTSVGRWRVE
jgi:ABC-type transport system substrate-binding protein